jgi:hypothetical protein
MAQADMSNDRAILGRAGPLPSVSLLFVLQVITLNGWLVSLVPGSGAVAAEWHVSPTGDDANPGTKERPFATLERARDAARARGRQPGDAAEQRRTIRIAPGIHRRTQPLDLDARDAGLLVRGPDDRSARLHAGRFINASAFAPIADATMRGRLDPAARNHLVSLDLASVGVAPIAVPKDIFSDGGGLPDLYVNDVPLPLSRWPNEEYATMETVLDRGDWSRGPGRHGGVFVARREPSGEWRPARWNVADGIWLEGYWRVPWDPQTIRVAAIDPANRTIAHAAAINGGIGSKYATKGSLGDGKEPWIAVNQPEEIDRPGEWCVHIPSQTLSLWPPPGFADLSHDGISLADAAFPVIRLKDAEGVDIERLAIEGTLGNGIEIVGGSGNSVAGCLLRNLGGTAVTVVDGTQNGVRSCDIHTIGEAGIRLAGGDRTTLSPCRHFAMNNDVSDVGRRRKTWAAAIHVGSFVGQFNQSGTVGCRVSHNFLHDLPHAAVLYDGNDNVLEGNEICRVALTSGDVGAFYTRQDWTSRGNLLRHNYVHDCPRANAFYIDDGDSGDTVEENMVVRCGCGPFIGGGHDNTIRHNLIVDCEIGIHFDSRGVSRGYATHPGYRRRVESARPGEPPWSDRYPHLARLLDTGLDAAGVVGSPHGNLITDNVTAGCGKSLRQSGKPAELRDNNVQDTIDIGDESPMFMDAAAGDLRLAAESPVLRKLPSFPQLSIGSFGLQRDAYRTALPALRRSASAPLTTPRFDSETDLDATNRAATTDGGQKPPANR